MLSRVGRKAVLATTVLFPLLSTPAHGDSCRYRYANTIGQEDAYNVFYNSQNGIKTDVTIAIIDTGVEIRHADFAGHVWQNVGEIPQNGIDDDQNGYIDDVNGFNFASRIASPLPEKSPANSTGANFWYWSHGTHAAGLAVRLGNDSVASPGRGRIKIMALNTMGRYGGMDMRWTTEAIYYAVHNGANVINLSLGGPNRVTQSYFDALRYATSHGVVVVAAAGNETSEIGTYYSAAGQAPWLPGLISIGAFQLVDGQKNYRSNYNPEIVELGAPGRHSAWEWQYTTSPETLTSRACFSGTSAATPIAAGAAALATGLTRSRGYILGAGEIESLLLDSARKTQALKPYFKDGNALDLENLADLINQRYPDK